MGVKDIVINPALIPSIIPALVAMVALLKGDTSTFLVEVIGIFSILLGIIVGQKIKDKAASAISLFILLVLSAIVLSSFSLAGYISAFISVLLVILLVKLELLSSEKDMLLLSSLVLALGGSLVLYAFLTGYPPKWRSDVQIPLALSLGLALIFISYPRVFCLMQGKGGVAITLISAILAFTSGFRADILFILVEFLVICLIKERYKELSISLPFFLFFLLLYGILRPGAYDLMKRIEAISSYLGDVVKCSIPYGVAKFPLWLFTTKVHPSQFIGRAFFGRSTGITLTLFGNMVFDAGLPELLILSFIVGIAGGHIYTKRYLYPYNYAIYLAIMTISSDAGFTQLFLLMIPALMLHESLLSWMKPS